MESSKKEKIQEQEYYNAITKTLGKGRSYANYGYTIFDVNRIILNNKVI